MSGRLAAIWRYPVKGLRGELLEQAHLAAGEGVPGDRRYALALNDGPFDPAAPAWFKKKAFAQQRENPRLILLETRFDEAASMVGLSKDGALLAAARLDDADGRAELDTFLNGYLAKDEDFRGLRTVCAEGVMFTDNQTKYVSIINRASLRDLSARAGQDLEEIRFRANLMIDDLPAWSEREWIDREITIGGARFLVVDQVGRCINTHVNPGTALHDVNVLKTLHTEYGHTDCGVFAVVVGEGEVKVGDGIVVGDKQT